MKKKYVEIEAIKINIDYSSNIVARVRSGCRQYVANEVVGLYNCETADPGKVSDYITPSDDAYLEWGEQYGC